MRKKNEVIREIVRALTIQPEVAVLPGLRSEVAAMRDPDVTRQWELLMEAQEALNDTDAS